MTKIKLVLELLDTLNDLLGVGVTSCNVHEARKYVDHIFDQLEVDQDTDENRLSKFLDDIDIKEKQMPKELKEYFYTMDSLYKAGYLVLGDEFHKVEEGSPYGI